MNSLSSKPRQRRCKFSGCRDYFVPKRKALKLEECCSPGCELSFAEESANKAFRAETTRMRKAFNEKDLKWQHKQCQPVFNKLRRLQELKWFADNNLQPICISCSGTIGGDTWCNGHYKSVGSSSSLRYDFNNSWLQHNFRCNSALSGDINGTATTHGYKQGLINRLGYETAAAIMEYCEANAAVVTRWTWQELEAMRKEWNVQIRAIEKHLSGI